MIKRKCDCEEQDCGRSHNLSESLEDAPVSCNLTRSEFFLKKLEFVCLFLNMQLAANAEFNVNLR